MRASPPPFDAILLTGGAGRRLGGIDKASVLLGGRPLVARAASAVSNAEVLVVVGPTPAGTLHPRTVVTREDPPGTGPVAALAAGVAHVTAPNVAVLPCDLPFVTAEAVAGLRRALAAAPAGTAAAMPVDEGGRDQPLCSVWRTDALRTALAGLGDPAGVAVRRLVAAAGPIVRLAEPHDGERPPWFDCDTPADVAHATEREQDHRP